MIKCNIKCDNCGIDFYMRPSRIARTEFIYCCKECRLKHQNKRNIIKLEKKLGIDNLKDYLYKKYIVEFKTSREIASLFYDNSENYNSVMVILKHFNISIRHGAEAIKTQRVGIKREIRSQQSRFNANKNFNTKESRDKLRKAMKSDEYIEKCRVAKIGELNGMFGIRGEENAKWDPNKTRDQRHKDRKLFINKEWRNKVFERDNYTCELTGERRTLVAHHLESYNTDIKNRFVVDNGITISEDAHKLFHRQYGYGNNTRKQFEEFKQNYNLTSAI